jgi:hypothetical protein
MLDIPAGEITHAGCMTMIPQCPFSRRRAESSDFFLSPAGSSPYKEGCALRANLDIPHLVLCALLKFTCVCARTSGRLFALSGAHLLSIYLDVESDGHLCCTYIRRGRVSHAARATKSASHHPDPIQSKHADQTFVPSNFISSASPRAQCRDAFLC